MTTGKLEGRHAPKDTFPSDRGCHVSPRCTECPLPRCIFDVGMTQELAERRLAQRVRQAQTLRDQGHDIQAIAQVMGASKRTVCRWLSRP